jgi:hypothetical protein
MKRSDMAPLSRREEIEAAIETHNGQDQERLLLLPPDAVRPLTLMFPRDTVYRRSVTSLQAEGFTKRALARLLKRLIDTGFLSKEPGQAGVVTTYRLHLAPADSAVTRSVRAPRPRRREIEAAIAAYNAADRETGPLSLEAARLLAVMFPRNSVCQRSVASLVLDGFGEKTIYILRAAACPRLRRIPIQKARWARRQPHLPPTPAAAEAAMKQARVDRARKIEAAIAAYNDTDPEMLLTPTVARLLTVMFADADVCQRTLVSLEREGLGMKPLLRLLQHLVEIGFVSKERHTGPGRPNVYRLHLQ